MAPAAGRLVLKGVSGTNLMLRSTADSTVWKLKVDALADQQVSLVDVKDSDAMTGVGAQVTALNSVGRPVPRFA